MAASLLPCKGSMRAGKPVARACPAPRLPQRARTCPSAPKPGGSMCTDRNAQPSSDASSSGRIESLSTAATATGGHGPQGRRSVLLGSAGALAAGALAGRFAAPGPASAALLEDDAVSMRVFDSASSSVVSILVFKPDLQGVQVLEGVGTGVVMDGYGDVVTNYHCVSRLDKKNGAQIKIGVYDARGRQQAVYESQLLGSDTQHDLAVLRAVGPDGGPPPGLRPITWGSSQDLQVGQLVFAVGNTYGQSKTLSAGVVSGLNRTIPSPVGTRIYGCIQTDAQINAGNSGGPLLDSAGRLVGICTATYTRQGSGRGSGVNFALPADLVREVAPNLVVYGNAMGKR